MEGLKTQERKELPIEEQMKAQTAIMRDADKFIKEMKDNQEIKPEVVSKITAVQTARYLQARLELKRLQDKNAEELTKHFKKSTEEELTGIKAANEEDLTKHYRDRKAA